MAGRLSEGIDEAAYLPALIVLCRNGGPLDSGQAFEQRAQLRRQFLEWRKVRRQRLSYGAANNLFQFGALRRIVQFGVASRPLIVLRQGVEFPNSSS